MMKIVVPIKLVPDLVDEFEIDASGKALDTTFMRLILNEFDEHAIEQAVLIKEKGGWRG
jgi:electron transfer flavoprotein beta subunit